MLQPVTTVPAAVSIAPPTLNCEYGATAWSRAERAADTSRPSSIGNPARRPGLNPPDDFLEKGDEPILHALGGLEHFLVTERLRPRARGHVRDAREPEHLEAHVASHDRFGHRGHAHNIGPDRPEVTDLGRRLVARAAQARVDAV